MHPEKGGERNSKLHPDVAQMGVKGYPQSKFAQYTDFSAFCRAMRHAHFDWDLQSNRSKEYHASLYSRSYQGILFTDIIFDEISGDRRPHHIKTRSDQYVGLNLFVEGEELITQNGQIVHAKENSLFLWDASNPTYFESKGTTRCMSIFLPKEYARMWCPNILELMPYNISIDHELNHLIYSHLIALHQSIDSISENSRAAVIQSTLNFFASCLHSDLQAVQGSLHQYRTFQRIQRHIQENLFEPGLSAQSCAADLGLGDRYMRRIFASFDTSFSSYVRKRRLDFAALAIRNSVTSGESITQIAYRHGFNSVPHFSKLFSVHFGISPSSYKERAHPMTEGSQPRL